MYNKRTLKVPKKDNVVGGIYVKELIGLGSTKLKGLAAESCSISINQGSSYPTHCVVGGAHALILRISSFVGLAPLRFEPHDNGYFVSLSREMCVYSYILITILAILAVFGMVAEIMAGVELSVRMTSSITQAVSVSDILVVVITACAGVYSAPMRMRMMLGVIEKVATVDNNIGGQYSKLTEKKLCAAILVVLISVTMLFASDFCFFTLQAVKVDRQWNMVLNYMGFYLSWFIMVMLELQFAFTALSVQARFRAINDALAITVRQVAVPIDLPKNLLLNIYAILASPVVDSMPTKETTAIIKRSVSGEPRLIMAPCEAIRQLAVLQGTLCEVVHCIDDSYGLSVIAILIATLLHLIIAPYFLFIDIIESTNRIFYLVLQLLWCTTHMLRLIVLVEPCYYTANERKRTEGLICRLMTATPSSVLSSPLELFSRQLMLQGVSYSPMGLCTLDRSLVASVIGAVTTYLVILIQFRSFDT